MFCFQEAGQQGEGFFLPLHNFRNVARAEKSLALGARASAGSCPGYLRIYNRRSLWPPFYILTNYLLYFGHPGCV